MGRVSCELRVTLKCRLAVVAGVNRAFCEKVDVTDLLEADDLKILSAYPDDEHFCSVDADVTGSVYNDLYGADADGNRGEWRTECEDAELMVGSLDITNLVSEVDYQRALEKLLEVDADGPSYEPEDYI